MLLKKCVVLLYNDSLYSARFIHRKQVLFHIFTGALRNCAKLPPLFGPAEKPHDAYGCGKPTTSAIVGTEDFGSEGNEKRTLADRPGGNRIKCLTS